MIFRRYWRIDRGIIEPSEATKPPIAGPQPCRSLRPERSLEEQIALVESGKAKVVSNFHPQHALPDRTLGGVSPEII